MTYTQVSTASLKQAENCADGAIAIFTKPFVLHFENMNQEILQVGPAQVLRFTVLRDGHPIG